MNKAIRSFGIFSNRDKDIGLACAKELANEIKERGAAAFAVSETAAEIGLEPGMTEEGVLEKVDAVICLGGDGSFLNVARRVFLKNIPLVGINLGSLGFLTEIERHEIANAVAHLVSGDYLIEERMMLESAIYRDGDLIVRDTALNDVVISRGALSRIIHLKTFINNDYAETFPGDGLIISSPTGSTAYALSAGGPIVEPDLDLIIVTPICPHLLYSRSYITNGDRSVKIVVDESPENSYMVTVDGRDGFEIKGGDIIEVSRSPKRVRLITVGRRNFFNVLRAKIHFR